VVNILLYDKMPYPDRNFYLRTLVRGDAWAFSLDYEAMMSLGGKVPHDNKIYRVHVSDSGVTVLCFGIESVDSNIDGHYDGVDDLPVWVQERLAVLMITDHTPPIPEVEGVGRRISSNVYWVYAPGATA
jgi:hypothetical protein